MISLKLISEDEAMKPTGKDLLDLLISLYAEQEGVLIKYETEEVHNA
jgi:hypothetical protein